ncbi:hypothetical protein SAMN05661096_02037 [Marivirga sericea]|uniref:DUF5683 domain-containing protein n=1 Tax=Marivirga sericea TaxID=1028 RepID=A0A1X7JW85_9BACT|nr:DUF5683 domain-containing protein [Marivirga sericea]SMG32498.1 hypothetical protein SAMN05661096_02037 [Marivirga sericea]
MRILVLIFILSAASSIAIGQKIQPTDSTFLKLGDGSEDIETFQMKDSTHSPRLAALYSAIVPGMGQFYNQKYWKIPIVYALGALAASQIKSNHQNYVLFRNVYFNIRNGNDEQIEDYLQLFNEEAAERRLESYERDRDYWIILAGLFYVLNIVDATVDAHLREFNINEDLSLNIKPSIQRSPYSNMHAGLSLNFRLK